MSDSRSHRRDQNEISYAILRSTLGGERKTKIMYRAAMNFRQLNQCLDALIARGMIVAEPGRRYGVTVKGKMFIAAYERYCQTRHLLSDQKAALGEFGLTAPRRTRGFEEAPSIQR